MPPKPKEAPKKTMPALLRQPISNSTLLWVPEDAVEGYQERLDRCVDWTIQGSAVRHHQEVCRKEDIPPVSFTEALQNKINNSILNGFLDENSTLSIEEHWNITLPLAIWDSERGTEERRICFKSENNITDGLMELIKITVRKNDRNILKNGLKESLVLRVTNSGMTYLDEGLKEYKMVTTLSLCGNLLNKLDCDMLPTGLRALELQANRFSSLESLTNLPHFLMYLGLSRNIINAEGLEYISHFPSMLTVLDLSDNDIYDLEPLLDVLVKLPNLTSLLLAGNPCSVCAAYAVTTSTRLQRLRWLDNRQVLKSDRASDKFEPHPDDLRSAYFNFTILRIVSPPCPPKPEKGATGTFHVAFELPLLDPVRRSYLMYGDYDTLEEMLPAPEDDYVSHDTSASKVTKETETVTEAEAESEETDIFMKLEPKNSLIIKHYTTYESNKVPWNKVMTFQEPAIRIFCPDLRALRNTFHSTITLKLIYTLTIAIKKPDKKTETKYVKPPPSEMSVTIATIRCSLRNPDWSQSSQHFHWDETLGTADAIHWGDGDLNDITTHSLLEICLNHETLLNSIMSSSLPIQAVQYQQGPSKTPKVKQDMDVKAEKPGYPDHLTCHFGFGVDTVHADHTTNVAQVKDKKGK